MAEETRSNPEPGGNLEQKPEISAVSPENKTEAPNMPEKAQEQREGDAEKEQAYAKILAQVETQTTLSDAIVAQDAATTQAIRGAEGKIEKLMQLAMHEGVVHAVKVAKHLEDNYALDEFHDRLLAEELHEALVKKGLIKVI